MNPFFQAMGGGNNPLNFMQQLQQFAATLQGSPKDIVQQKLNSGEMSQQQFNVLMQTAQQLQSMFGK